MFAVVISVFSTGFGMNLCWAVNVCPLSRIMIMQRTKSYSNSLYLYDDCVAQIMLPISIVA